MPMYDYECNQCGVVEEHLEPIGTRERPCVCGGTQSHIWVQGNAGNVIGDEIDVTIKHGLCNDDGTPRRYRSRKELNEAATRKKMTSYVVHEPPPGTDKSKHTSRWV